MRLLLLPVTAWALGANGAAPSQPPPLLVAIAPIVVPIVGSDRLEGALRLKLMVAAHDEPALARLTERLPALRAASVSNAIEFSRLYVSGRAPVDARKLRAGLKTALRAEDADVADILIVEVSAVADA